MLLPAAADHLEVVLLEFLKPACKLAFFENPEPGERTVVGPYNKALPQEVYSEVIGVLPYSVYGSHMPPLAHIFRCPVESVRLQCLYHRRPYPK